MSELLKSKMWVSAQLNIAALILSVSIGIPLGLFAALKQGTLESGMASDTPVMEDFGRLLGSPPEKVYRDLHLPMLRWSLWTAILLVFVDVKKELPVTLIFWPYNFSTLAIRAFAYASDEMLQEALPWCLAIVLMGLPPVILLNRKLLSGQTPHETSYRLMPIVEKNLTQAA